MLKKRAFAGVLITMTLLALLAACSSDSAPARSCPSFASCYTMTMTVPSSAPSRCDPGTSQTGPADWRTLKEGTGIDLNNGCRSTVGNCAYNIDCASYQGKPFKLSVTFSESGFSGSGNYDDCPLEITGSTSDCSFKLEDAGPEPTDGSKPYPICSCGTRKCGYDACGSSCGECGKGEVCNSVGICLLDPDSLWSVTAVSGSIAPGSWDGLDETPEPFMCVYGLTSPSPSCTTKPAASTFAPSWNQIVVPSARAGDLLKGLDFEVKDEDTTAAGADDVCTRVTKPVTESNLKAGTLNIQCTVGASISTVVVKFAPL